MWKTMGILLPSCSSVAWNSHISVTLAWRACMLLGTFASERPLLRAPVGPSIRHDQLQGCVLDVQVWTHSNLAGRNLWLISVFPRPSAELQDSAIRLFIWHAKAPQPGVHTMFNPLITVAILVFWNHRTLMQGHKTTLTHLMLRVPPLDLLPCLPTLPCRRT